jgi:hypothetical protein
MKNWNWIGRRLLRRRTELMRSETCALAHRASRRLGDSSMQCWTLALRSYALSVLEMGRVRGREEAKKLNQHYPFLPTSEMNTVGTIHQDGRIHLFIYIYIYCRRATYGHSAAKVAIRYESQGAKRRPAGTDVACRAVSAPDKCGSFGIVTDREHRSRVMIHRSREIPSPVQFDPLGSRVFRIWMYSSRGIMREARNTYVVSHPPRRHILVMLSIGYGACPRYPLQRSLSG